MQVAERSLFLWNNEYIVTLVAQHRQVILPVVFNALESNARSHWNPAVHGLTSNVKKVFQDMDLVLWRECEAHYQQEEVCSCVLSLALLHAMHIRVWQTRHLAGIVCRLQQTCCQHLILSGSCISV